MRFALFCDPATWRARLRARTPSLAARERFRWRLAVCALWVALARAILVLHSGVMPHPLWALLSDASAAVLLAMLLPRSRLQGMRWGFVILAGLGLYASGRHLAIHGTHFRLGHFAQLNEPVLLSASIVDTSLLLLPGYLLLAWLLVAALPRLPASGRSRIAGSLLALSGICTYAAVVPGLTLPANSPLLSMVAQVPEYLLRVHAASDPIPRDRFVRDVDDEPFFALYRNPRNDEEPPNVLLILVEGLSGAFMPGIAQHHGLEPTTALPELETTLQRHDFHVWRNVLAIQRQTHRGTYALLCGDYPRLDGGATKMQGIIRGDARIDCLPALLAANGYDTHYIQAAPLSFMRKGRFMSAIGFGEIHGAESFGVQAEAESGGWGASDARYFSTLGKRLRRINDRRAPWFATLLNVGTHHPYPAAKARRAERASPDAPVGRTQDSSDRSISFARMAEALGAMLDRLAADGLLDDTVVLISSDEASTGVRASTLPRPLDGNFGFFALRLPPSMRDTALVDRDTLLANLDIAVTLADVAGVDNVGALMGRSALARDDKRPRSLMLGDTYSGQIFFLSEEGRLMVCGEARLRCTQWRFQPGRLFASLTEAPGDRPLVGPAERELLIGATGALGAARGPLR